MRSVVLLYDTCCVYEIVILNYFLRFSGKETVFASLDGKPVTSMEGYSLNVSCSLGEVAADGVELAVVPGGNIKTIDCEAVYRYLNSVKAGGGLIAGICAGVDVLDHAGILDGIESTHSTELDVAVTGRVITARANGYVDFAVEVAKKMGLFKDEDDLKETVAFWRDYKRMQ